MRLSEFRSNLTKLVEDENNRPPPTQTPWCSPLVGRDIFQGGSGVFKPAKLGTAAYTSETLDLKRGICPECRGTIQEFKSENPPGSFFGCMTTSYHYWFRPRHEPTTPSGIFL